MTIQSAPAPRRAAVNSFFDRLPYWLLAAILLGVVLLWKLVSDQDYRVIFSAVQKGLWVSIWVTLVAFAGAVLLGLIVGLLRVSKNRVIIEFTNFYVEIIRGVPMLVLLYYIVFVGAPGLVIVVNWLGRELTSLGVASVGDRLVAFNVRNFSLAWRAILALVIGYSAFISEIFRAGIESIGSGQTEAALSLGMTRWQALRFVVLPQAVRRVLPPLGNDFIAMLKDSALVSVLGIQDITLMGKVYAASTFLFFETYNVVAFLYLVMTIALSLVVRALEKYIPST